MKYRKAKKRLDARIADYYRMISKLNPEQAAGYHCPGSLKK